MVVEGSAREQLLQAVIDYVAEHGVGDLTLRRLAAAIGTSHRMLIYHFGSKEGLLIAVVRAVEDEQRRMLDAFELDRSLSPADVMRRMWQHLADPALRANERLFFETYGHALMDRAHAPEFLDGIVESWIDPLAEIRMAHGTRAGVARAQARLDLAVTRGLLLDLVATGDRKGTDAAFEQYIALSVASSGASAV
jgi:AcrR family transcriptional regulator